MIQFFTVLLLLRYLIQLRSINVIDLLIDDLQSSRLHYSNVSLGFDHHEEYMHQCDSLGKIRSLDSSKIANSEMNYTPNREPQLSTVDKARHQLVKHGVILVVGGHSDSYYNYGPSGGINGLMSVWDSWVENFFSQTSNSSSLVLLFDERDFLRNNLSITKNQYLDIILKNNMGAKSISCVHLRYRKDATRTSNSKNCNNYLPLDQGYYIYSVDVTPFKNSSYYQKPLIVFAAVHRFPIAEWVVGQDEENLFKTWKPFRLNRRYPTNYAYVKMTNWYSYHMLNLQILDFFDYGGKLDNDVSFVAPFLEPNIPLKLAKKETKMLITAKEWYYDDPRIAQGTKQCLLTYIDIESQRCHQMNMKKNNTIGFLATGKKLTPPQFNSHIFWESNLNATFRAHFISFWLGLYTAPEVKHLAKYWNDVHPRGMWDYRWGDQQWWPRPMSMFGNGNASQEVDHFDDLINSDNGNYVVHKLWPRQGTIAKTQYFSLNTSESVNRTERWRRYQIAAKPFLY